MMKAVVVVPGWALGAPNQLGSSKYIERIMSTRVRPHKRDSEQIYLTCDAILDGSVPYRQWFDPCPHPRPPDYDGLAIPWEAQTFVNPPWGNVKPWIIKAIHKSQAGKVVHMLLPAGPSAHWFHDLCVPFARSIEFCRGPVPFLRVRDGSRVALPAMIVKFEGPQAASAR